MKRNIATTPLVILFAAFALSAAAMAQVRDPACSYARAAGTYGFSTSGTIIGVGPRVSEGTITLAADGTIPNGTGTANLNGVTIHEQFSGTYTVNSNCTGTATIAIRDLSGNLLLTATLDSVWDDNMKQSRYVFTSITLPSGAPLLAVISAEARKMVP